MLKICRFCKDQVKHVDYKDIALLKSFVNERGKITPSRSSGLCAIHQRKLTRAIKRARSMSLLSYIVR